MQDLHYNGPLPPSCQCSPAHPPLRGEDSHGEFHSSSSSTLGESFWRFCVDPWIGTEFTSLRAQGFPTAYSGTFASSHSPGFSSRPRVVCLSSLSSSRCSLYCHWKELTLTKTVLADFIGASITAAYFAGLSSPSGVSVSSACRVSAVGLQLQSPSLVWLVTSTASSLCFLSCFVSVGGITRKILFARALGRRGGVTTRCDH